MNDTHHTLEDFLLDNCFIHWVTDPTPALDHYWAEWQARHPHQKTKKARLVVQEATANSNHAQLSDEEVQTMWQQLQTRHLAKDRLIIIITMQPSELVEIDATNVTQKQVDVAEYTAWINDALLCNGTTIAEIAQFLEDDYGLQVHLTDSSLAKRWFRGRAASDDIPSLLGQIEKVFQLMIEQKGNKGFIRSRTQSRPQDT